MEISKKYYIYNFLDDLDEMDYLYQITSVQQKFEMTLEDVE